MGINGCSAGGQLDESRFDEPMPWIGIYVAAASSICGLAMAADLIRGIRYQKFWFPVKFFALNATTLTLIAVAVKLSVDLNTSMPRAHDQLSKLSSDVLICTIMANFMPSIGTMENQEMIMNIMALGILVITSIVNICIQLGTGVIYVFWKEHALVMLLMVVFLTLFCSSAIAVGTTKCYFEQKYKSKHEIAEKECCNETEERLVKRLRKGLVKYWIMAQTSSPQFVICRSATCTASGAFCLLSTAVLAEAMIRTYFIRHSFRFCQGESDYKWSTTLILITQTLAVAVGTVAPATRWFTAINFRQIEKSNQACKREFKVEKYWIQILLEWKERPISSSVRNFHLRKLAYNARNRVLDSIIRIQQGVVLVSKVTRLVSIVLMSRVYAFIELIKCRNSVSATDCDEFESQPGENSKNLRRFVMHLEGEEQLVDLVLAKNCPAPLHFTKIGQNRQPSHLINFLENNLSKDFRGVIEFDSNLVPSLGYEEPPNSWMLPIVTLTSVAISLPGIDKNLVKTLLKTIHESVIYIRAVESNLILGKKFRNVRNAAETIWLGVDLHHKWLSVDLYCISDGKNPREVLEEFSNVAKAKFTKFHNKCSKEIPSRWPVKVLAANLMYRICQTILLDCEFNGHISSEIYFQKLTGYIADILGACLTNLGHVITMQCHSSAIEEREKCVRYAIILLGKTEKVLKILEHKSVPISERDELAYIDFWRKQMSSSSKYSEMISFRSSNIYLNVD